LISRELSPHFNTVLGTDPSPPMIAQAQSSSTKYPNITFEVGTSEDLSSIPDASVDMVVAGQAAHWFDYSKAWPQIAKKVRKGGTLAFWGYKDNIFVDYPKASKILEEYCYGDNTMGPFWEQPGRSILRDKLHAITPPSKDWEQVERIEYEPGTNGKASGEGEVLMQKRLKLGEVEGYARTFSSYHNWMAGHEGVKSRKDGGEGDIIDEMLDTMLEAEPEWRAKGDQWRDFEVDCEWGSVILLARRK
jgi:SAM-dependent methyltransferase